MAAERSKVKPKLRSCLAPTLTGLGAQPQEQQSAQHRGEQKDRHE